MEERGGGGGAGFLGPVRIWLALTNFLQTGTSIAGSKITF